MWFWYFSDYFNWFPPEFSNLSFPQIYRFDFASNEKHKSFSNSTWSSEFRLCLENCPPRRRRNFPRKSAKGGWGGEVFPGFMLRWFGQVFPPWSDHPLAPFEEARPGFWKLWKGAKFLQRTRRTSCRSKFLHGIFGFGRLSGRASVWTQDDDAEEDGFAKT